MRTKRHRSGPATEAESDTERTGYMPVPVDDACPRLPGDIPGRRDPDAAFADELFDGHEPENHPPRPRSKHRRRISRILLGTGAVLIALLAVYAVDLLRNIGDVPRGVVVLGVDVGGMPHDEAEAKLRRVLTPRLTEPVTIHAGDVRAILNPAEAGLHVNWAATLQRAGRQSLNPIARVRSLFGTREVDVVSTVNTDKLHAAITRLAQRKLNHPATEGRIDFMPVPGDSDAVHAFAVEPRQGQQLVDIDRAVRIIRNNWLRTDTIDLPMRIIPVRATARGVHATLERTVAPMISAPVVLRGDGVTATLQPATIAESLRFSPRDDGTLLVEVDQSVLRHAVQPQLGLSEKRPRNAELTVTASGPQVRPGLEGRQIDWSATFDSFTEVATRQQNRVLQVAYTATAPEVTTGELDALGLDQVVGRYSVDGLSGAAAHNVATVAAAVDGTLVQPGETFRLNTLTGVRDAAAGYVLAPSRPDGSGPEVTGGGISTFTTALYNAAYLAGMRDAGHTAHRYYFSTFDGARDAVALSAEGEPVPLAFTNDTSSAVLITTDVSGGSVTVTLWGTKHYRVEVHTSTRSDIEAPPVEHGGSGDCQPRDGTPGFTVSTTRVLYDAETGEKLDTHTTTVTYAPRPRITCRAPASLISG